MQDKPPPVPQGATQGGANPQAIARKARWRWAEASVWTERMLEALEHGVKGGMWYSLIDNRSVFGDVDGWVRGRLRSLLRKRHKRPGKAKGADHQRWPNAFFAQLGLYSLTQARLRLHQPA